MTDSRLSPERAALRRIAAILHISHDDEGMTDLARNELREHAVALRVAMDALRAERDEAQRIARAADGYQREAFEEVDRLKTSLATARAEGRAEGLEEAAKVADAERASSLTMANEAVRREDRLFWSARASAIGFVGACIRALAASEAAR